MRLATFNVNSVKVRLPGLLEWLAEAAPDVVLLQEIKCQDENFPADELAAAGYQSAVHGQKAYNGVAILSRYPMSEVQTGLPDPFSRTAEDGQARFIAATICGIRVHSLYVPNGNPTDGPKYPYKLSWLDRLIDYVEKTLLPHEVPFVLGGDFNICPDDSDCYDPLSMREDALCLLDVRQRYRRLLNLGLWDAWRTIYPLPQIGYSYWDYVQGRFQKDHGLRIDHFLLSPQVADCLRTAGIDQRPRGRERPSDHTPVWCELAWEKRA